jgi:TetR/AcrR family transcriptional regulator, regulator of biofilm formation and stress response
MAATTDKGRRSGGASRSARAAKAGGVSSRVRGAARREALLEAVLRIVAEIGPDAVTHRRVAEEANLPLASTTYYFESKEHLLTAALDLAADRDTHRLLAATSSILGEESVSAAAALEAAVAVIADPLDEGFEQGRGSLIATYRLLLEGARRPAMQAIAARWNEVYLLALGQLLERAGSEHPRADAELLLCAVDGLIVEELASGASNDPRPRLRRLVHALVDRR